MKSITGTDTGLVRTSNQDSCFASDTPIGSLPNLYVLADGMGGHLAGEYASSYTIEQFVRILSQDSFDPAVSVQNRLAAAAMEVNESLHKESASLGEHQGTGTTLVAAVVEGGVLHAINIGDSRLYRISRDKIEQVSQDHSYAEEMVRMGVIKRDSEDYLSNKHIITRAIGPWESVLADTFAIPLHEDEGILLCSDGLTGMLSDSEILEIFSRYSILLNEDTMKSMRDELIQTAKDHGGTDNITVVLAVPCYS